MPKWRTSSKRDRLAQDLRRRPSPSSPVYASGYRPRAGRTRWAARGAWVVLADRQVDLAHEVATRIREAGGRATAEDLDVTDFPAMNRLVQNTFQSAGRLDYVFNIAGIGIVGEARYYELEDWYRVLDVNLRGVVHGVQAAYPIMLRQGFGHIVNMASAAGLWPSPFVVSYCASKHAVVGLSTSLRIEAAAAGIRVSVLCPGAVRTPALTAESRYGKVLPPIPPKLLQKIVERQRPMRPERFAEANAAAMTKPGDHRHPILVANRP